MEHLSGGIIVSMLVAFVVIIFITMTVRIVPQQTAYVVERLGRFQSVLQAGIHFIAPFFDKVAYRHSLKEISLDIPEQICITKDNVQVGVDGVVFLQVVDPKMASYGIYDYNFAISQLAQTTMRSEVGKIELDRTFEERMHINTAIVTSVDEAARAWGVKILRYEIKNIVPPQNVIHAMEKQMQAEREKRAVILQAEGQKQAAINIAEGEKQKVVLEAEGAKQRVVLESEATMTRQINEAEGQANAIRAVANATSDGIKAVALSIHAEGGIEAVQLRVAENLVHQFGSLAKTTNTMILPANFGDMASMIATAMSVVRSTAPKA